MTRTTERFIYTAIADNGQEFTRQSNGYRNYTHAVLVTRDDGKTWFANSWHARRALAVKERKRILPEDSADCRVRVVPVIKETKIIRHRAVASDG